MVTTYLRDDPHKVYNATSTVNPTVNDDTTAGFDFGSRFFNTTSGELFICQSPSLGAAVWVPANNATKAYGFAGVNNAGPGAAAVTLTPAVVGQKVINIFDVAGTTLDASVLFESTISVAGEIQQLSATNLSAKHYIVVLG